MNESIDTTNCNGKGNCQQGEVCLTHHLWEDLSRQIHSFLSGISLSHLVSRKDVQQVAQRQHAIEELMMTSKDESMITSTNIA